MRRHRQRLGYASDVLPTPEHPTCSSCRCAYMFTQSLTISITTSQAVPKGGSILVAATVDMSGTPHTAASCADSALNPYTTDATRRNGGQFIILCSTHGLAAQLAAGSTITVTWSGGGGSGNERMQAFFVT